MRALAFGSTLLLAACGGHPTVSVDLPETEFAENLPLRQALWLVPDGPAPRQLQSAMLCSGLDGADIPFSVIKGELKRGALSIAAVHVTDQGVEIDGKSVATLKPGGWAPEDLKDGALVPVLDVVDPRRRATETFVQDTCNAKNPVNRAILVVDTGTPWGVVQPVVTALGRAGYRHVYLPVDTKPSPFGLPEALPLPPDAPKLTLGDDGGAELDGAETGPTALTDALLQQGEPETLVSLDAHPETAAGNAVVLAASARAADWTLAPGISSPARVSTEWAANRKDVAIKPYVPAVRIDAIQPARPAPAGPAIPGIGVPTMDVGGLPEAHETMIASGTITLEQVVPVLEEEAGSVYSCTDDLDEDELPEGYISTWISIAATGEVTGVEVKYRTVGDPELVECVVKQVEGMTFPAGASLDLGELGSMAPGAPGTLAPPSVVMHAWRFPEPERQVPSTAE